jgi:hypothetical protein
MKKNIVTFIFFLLILISIPVVFAQTQNENNQDAVTVFNLELEKILNLFASMIAFTLASLTYLSFRRSRNNRLIFVTIAFALFAFKLFMIGSELFFLEWIFVDQISSILDFVILITFFLGIIKK